VDTTAPGFAALNPDCLIAGRLLAQCAGCCASSTEHLMKWITRMVVGCLAAVALNAAAQTAPVAAAFGAADVTTLTAKIEAIDYASRVVAIKGPLGRTVALKVDDRVKNFGKIKAGDEIVLKYTEALTVTLTRAGAPRSATVTTAAPVAAPSGSKPGVAMAQQTKVVARIEQVDARRQVVLLEWPNARYAEVKVKDAGLFGALKVGESVEITFTEAVVVDVVTPKK
jgi:hypothetical protein